MFSKRVDVWSQTVGLLSGKSQNFRCTSFQERAPATAPRKKKTNDLAGLKVLITSRPSSTTATVNWSSPHLGLYGDQIWRYGSARKNGVCALSGTMILRGDGVFLPRRGNNTPVNADAMILATYMEVGISTW